MSNNKRVIILSGISGAGKSYMIPKIADTYRSLGLYPITEVVSADHFFLDSEDNHRFDDSKLSEAHATCFRKYIENLSSDKLSRIIKADVGTCHCVFVDNTNTTSEEIAPYILGAQAFGYEPEIITIHCPMLFASERNLHKVPFHVIEKQYYNIARRNLMPWWKNTDIHYKLDDPQFDSLKESFRRNTKNTIL